MSPACFSASLQPWVHQQVLAHIGKPAFYWHSMNVLEWNEMWTVVAYLLYLRCLNSCLKMHWHFLWLGVKIYWTSYNQACAFHKPSSDLDPDMGFLGPMPIPKCNRPISDDNICKLIQGLWPFAFCQPLSLSPPFPLQSFSCPINNKGTKSPKISNKQTKNGIYCSGPNESTCGSDQVIVLILAQFSLKWFHSYFTAF